MNIKKKMPKLLSALLSFSMVLGTVIPAYATDVFITESELEDTMLNETALETASLEENMALNEGNGDETGDGIETLADTESRYEEVEVKYNQSSSYFVTIPKTIVLGADRKSLYSIKVEGDIVSNKQVCVVPVDKITDTEVFDFYMEDQITGSTKDDVVAEVNQAKFYWNYEEAKAGYEENDNYIIAEGLSAGKWKGTFQMEISMRTDPAHIHNYVGEVTKEPTCTEPGEKTYTCGCGDSYTEEIPAKGHHYENGTCTDCGDKDPNHEHKYTEEVTKEPTCTDEGEKTYTCDCGDSYTEKIPAKGHHYENGTCTDCGDEDPNHKHDYTETVTKEPTCTEDGEKTYTCECDDSYTEVIHATGHNYVDNTTDNNHICTVCKNVEEHIFIEEITKEATCTEDGEKVYTCTVCGKSYTEVIPAYGSHIDEDGDNVCDRCGHTHVWEENIDSYQWIKDSKSNSTNMLSQNGDVWKAKYTSSSYTINGYWNITVPEDIEYTIDYYLNQWGSDSVTIYLDNEVIATKSSNGSASLTINLTAGTHTIRLLFKKQTTSASSPYATITLKPINMYNHVCNECGDKEEHIYEGTVIKPATCMETGEILFTCIKCGHNYTDVIPVDGGRHIDENDDDICDKCGHKHIWEENTDSIAWTRQLPSNSMKQSGNTWTLDYENGTQYSTYQLHGNWKVTIPLDAEYTFNYDNGFMYADDNVKIYVDDNLIVDFNGKKSGSEKIFLTEGTHVIQMYLDKKNQITSATYARITLNPVVILDHICTECNEKELHHYGTEGVITKEPTCTEKGEKKYFCVKCNGSKAEEIDELGHHYVEGICDRCGSLNLVSAEFWSAKSSSSTTTDSGHGHYDKAYLGGTYSPNIEITEDMSEDEYLLLNFYVGYPWYGTSAMRNEVDGISGLSMLQKYDEETGLWETIYSYELSFNTTGYYMANQEGGYNTSMGDGINRYFQLEKGTYRAYGRFSANPSCASSASHHFYSYRISVSLCQIEQG